MLVKDANGEVSWHETGDVRADQGRLFGAIAGGLLGLAGGPIGAIIGAAARAAAGGVVASQVDMGCCEEYLKTMQDSLNPGTCVS